MADLDTLPGANNSTTTIPARILGPSAKAQYRHVPVSFETGEQGAHKVYFSQPVTITGWRGQVTKNLAATDAGTITLKDASGNNITPNAVVTLAASSVAFTTEWNNSGASTANVAVAAGSFVQLVTAKTTAGGRATVSLEYVPS